MSPSMILGRVVLPLAGLAIACAVAWQFAFARPNPIGASPAVSSWDEKRKSLADSSTIVAEGRVVPSPGGKVVVSAEVPGTIAKVAVVEKSAVKKGDVLVEFEAAEAQSAFREAAAQLAEAETQLAHCIRDGAELDADRYKALVSRLNRDYASHEVSSARARRDSARATLDRAEAVQAKHRLVAPIDGVVTIRHVEPGETVPFAAPLITIVDLSRLRIEAEVDEFDISRCSKGAAVKITAEGYDGKSWTGEVAEIADTVVGRGLRPEDPARPSDTNVLPVKITFREPNPLKLGQRVEVRISNH